ncbi:hypothetical protein [Paraburkholderia gardini]|uniref:Uncharacterized protein n=1 Tax=Paraburkholderia gardini TaxID=2823469 RepID=A0ABM8U6M4_9BURK|nr:hypothetical protein [Paraburkholderia gardini]CAG4901932.1 hypothetical protein R69919_02894 [Paraburkholderia gardini]CAG4909243.1 hypothetical protein R54767_03578 [Paraburkholderia gardini]
MRHTVIGLFDTYTQAEGARDTLVQTGFARTDIELQANPVTPSGAGIDPAANLEAGHGFMANIERFLSSLFASGPRPADPATTARYADAVRRGAVLVCVSAASESHAELAGRTLAKLGAVDIGERAPAWDSPMMDATTARDQSMLDELGIGAAGAVPPPLSPVPPVSPATERPMLEPLDPVDPARVEARDHAPLGGTSSGYDTPEPYDDATRAVSMAAAPGSGAYMTPASPAADADADAIGAPVPDEFLEYEEDFRGHYDEKYAAEDARYEDYSGAYHYGAKMGQDVRYRDRQWDDIEPEARRNWETTPQGDTWERVKAAVRHGWDRVTGHHHV